MSAEQATAVVGNPARTRSALTWAFAAAVWGFGIAFITMRQDGSPGDFYSWYVAAKALVAGDSPYAVIPAIDPERFQSSFLYPLPAAILTVPFVPLPYAVAGPLFVAIASALLAFGLAREGTQRLWAFASAPYIVSAASGTWSLPIAAAALLPAVGFLVVAKPNVGIASFLYRPSRLMIFGSIVLVVVSLLIWPTWPSEWLGALGGVQNRVIPLLSPIGPFLLLAATRWRRPEARLLLGYACVPQAPWFYDQLVLFLIPATALESLNYVAVSQLGLAVWLAAHGLEWKYGAWFLAIILYLPPLLMILRRPNEGSVPAWLERLIAGALRRRKR